MSAATVSGLNPAWGPEMIAAASAEGWDLFDCFGSENGPLQVQAFDCPEEGEPDITDTQAWRLVWDGARAGSTLHRTALQLLYAENRIEYDALVRWCQDHDPSEDA